MSSRDIGMDLGTASILVYVKGKGIALCEPSVVAIDVNTNKIKAVGADAQKMLGRTPGNIIAVRPLREGVISDYVMTEKMIKEFIKKVLGFRLFKPNIVVCIPSIITEVEERAVTDACLQAGAKRVFLIEEPVAAAIGAGIDITKPYGNLIMDIGGGTTDIAVISLGGLVVSNSIKVAGGNFDEAIVRNIRKNYSLFIGESSAEAVKIRIGTAYKHPEVEEMEVVTVSGWVMNTLERMPEEGDNFSYQNMDVTVLEMDERRVGKVRINIDRVNDDEEEE